MTTASILCEKLAIEKNGMSSQVERLQSEIDLYLSKIPKEAPGSLFSETVDLRAWASVYYCHASAMEKALRALENLMTHITALMKEADLFQLSDFILHCDKILTQYLTLRKAFNSFFEETEKRIHSNNNSPTFSELRNLSLILKRKIDFFEVFLRNESSGNP